MAMESLEEWFFTWDATADLFGGRRQPRGHSGNISRTLHTSRCLWPSRTSSQQRTAFSTNIPSEAAVELILSMHETSGSSSCPTLCPWSSSRRTASMIRNSSASCSRDGSRLIMSPTLSTILNLFLSLVSMPVPASCSMPVPMPHFMLVPVPRRMPMLEPKPVPQPTQLNPLCSDIGFIPNSESVHETVSEPSLMPIPNPALTPVAEPTLRPPVRQKERHQAVMRSRGARWWPSGKINW